MVWCDHVQAALHHGWLWLQARDVVGHKLGQEMDVRPVCLLVPLVRLRLTAHVVADLHQACVLIGGEAIEVVLRSLHSQLDKAREAAADVICARNLLLPVAHIDLHHLVCPVGCITSFPVVTFM